MKDLSRLGRELSKVIIVDNSPASYIFHPENAVSGPRGRERRAPTSSMFVPSNTCAGFLGLPWGAPVLALSRYLALTELFNLAKP